MSFVTSKGNQTLLISTFSIRDTICGIDTNLVQEVVLAGDITRVHNAIDYILGIINLRGKIVTIIELGKKIGMPTSAITDSSRIFIIEWKDEYIGLLVDKVSDTIIIQKDALSPPPLNVKSDQVNFLKGYIKQKITLFQY